MKEGASTRRFCTMPGRWFESQLGGIAHSPTPTLGWHKRRGEMSLLCLSRLLLLSLIRLRLALFSGTGLYGSYPFEMGAGDSRTLAGMQAFLPKSL